MSDTTMETPKPTAPVMNNKVNPDAVSDETSVITAGTVLTGDIASDGSFDIQGTINGNVTCNGKLVVTGTINGNSAASEFFAPAVQLLDIHDEDLLPPLPGFPLPDLNQEA